MNVFILCIAMLALIRPCLAIDHAEAARILYFYFAYDLDVQVWGQGKGYIAAKCKGTVRQGGRCTLNEFINYIETGKASTTPEYDELDSDVTLSSGDVLGIIDALQKIKAFRDDQVTRIVPGRKSTVGVVDDIAIIMDKDHKRAEQKNVGISRHWNNLKEALEGFQAHQLAKIESGFTQRMQKWKEDFVWKFVDRNSKYVESKWKKIDWEATVAAHPELADRKSALYQNMVKAIKGYDGLDSTWRERSVATKLAGMFSQCFKG